MDLCRRCPFEGAADPLQPQRRSSLLASTSDHERFRVVVASGALSTDAPRTDTDVPNVPFASDHADPSFGIDWQEAVTAIALAIVERGGTVVAPANGDVAHLLALAVYPHAVAHRAERADVGAPLEVHETGGYSESARLLLAPFVHRNVISYFDSERRVVPPDDLPRADHEIGFALARSQHHPCDPLMGTRPLGAVLVYPDDAMIDELRNIQQMDAPNVQVIGDRYPSELTSWVASHDTIRAVAADFRSRDDRSPLPYGFLMEWLVDFWLQDRK